jgi:hypothetical protein
LEFGQGRWIRYETALLKERLEQKGRHHEVAFGGLIDFVRLGVGTGLYL